MFNNILSDEKCGCSTKPKPRDEERCGCGEKPEKCSCNKPNPRDEERCGCGSGEKPEKCPCNSSKPKPRDEDKCGCGSGEVQTKCPCNKPKPRPQNQTQITNQPRENTRTGRVMDFDALVSEQVQRFQDLLSNLDKALIVRIFLPGCGPCTMTAKPFSDFAQSADVMCLNINANVYSTLITHLKALGVPTFIFFKKSGVESSRFSGRNNLLQQLNENLILANLE